MQEWFSAEPPAALAPYVGRICGYRLAGSAPGVHVGMPSPALTLVVALGPPIVVATPGSPPRAYTAMVAGLHQRAAAIHHDGTQHGLQVDLTPAGARALLGCPASELVSDAVDLGDLLDPADRFVAEQAEGLGSWPERVERVLVALTRRLDEGRQARPEVAHAWHQVTRSHGRLPVRDVAASVGWSARHLGEQFRAEYGLGVKTAARVARFSRSAGLVQRGHAPLVEVAARCGYADQQHMAREWRELAGTSPSRWSREDELAFVHDEARPAAAG